MKHPPDPACAPPDRQCHLGGALLVAPVFDEAGVATRRSAEAGAGTRVRVIQI